MENQTQTEKLAVQVLLQQPELSGNLINLIGLLDTHFLFSPGMLHHLTTVVQLGLFNLKLTWQKEFFLEGWGRGEIGSVFLSIFVGSIYPFYFCWLPVAQHRGLI